MVTLGELAEALALPLTGDPERPIDSLASIDRAQENQLSFVVGPSFLGALKSSQAAAVILPAPFAEHAPGDYLVSADPYASMARASWILAPETLPDPGIDPRAVVGGSSCISPTAVIGPGVVIGDESTIGDRVIIGANTIIGDRVDIGSDTRLFPGVVVYDRVRLGQYCRIQSGAIIGGEGFGYADTPKGWQAIRQSGGVHIGNRVHIGANSTVDSGTLDATRIGDDVILDNQIQIAHNVIVGDNTAIAGCTGIAGSTVIGRGCRIGGACNIVGHIRIADGVVLNAASLVTRDIEEKGRYGSGTALLPVKAWRRNYLASGQIADMLMRLVRLERQGDINQSKES